jgi:PPOX class probable F420-dependent enzyme
VAGVGPTTIEKLPPWAGGLLDEQPVARLGLIDDDGFPRVLPVTFAIAQNAAWSVVDDKPKRRPGHELARVRWLTARPKAVLTVDRYDDDWSKLAWVQITGHAEVLEPADHVDAMAALAARYPAYREHTPRGPLIRLAPVRAVCWRAAGR